ncbi:TlpA family protein disulfide reductase [Nonlabens sp. Asnod2-A12]|uniref:TlpA family protein disulfide reductase n=1 Tax=Nonlabens sp. Asnod2-A12 TaxID=3160578 RepID=UPI003864642F
MKKLSLSNIIFIVVIALLIIPQTRKPIQVALQKIRVQLFSPSTLDKEDQQQLEPFTYHLRTLDGISKGIEIGQGRVTFISYWATWCPPCIAEFPSIDKLFKDYGNEIDFLLITNEDPEIVKRFLKEKEFDIPVVLPQMNTPEELYESSIPTSYIIDATGKVIIKEQGAVDWNSTEIREVIDQLIIN